jgi:hypothetical protein
MKSFYIVTNPHRDGAGNFKIGTVRELPSGNWVWSGLGRSSRQLSTEDAARKAAKRAFGNVRFEEVLQ